MTTSWAQVALLAAVLVLAACASAPARVETAGPEAVATPQAAASATLEAAPAAQQAPEAAEPFQVSNEVYSRTFEEIEGLIQRLNRIIQDGDFETWREHLSAGYIEVVGSLPYLEAQSNQPLLKNRNVQLRCLEDYFEHVVIPSRSGASLDDIEFIDENHVKAISVIHQTRGLLYLLVREDDRWKIGIW